MMSCKFVTAQQAENYFEHARDYYTKNRTNYDRWHGSLAAAYGLEGELSKEQFDIVLRNITEKSRKRAGLDCTFSAPKSVSLAMAKNEQTRQEMIEAHQEAVSRVAKKIELELLQTRSNGKTFLSRNAIMAEFMHTMARPTKNKSEVPDLDLHSHLLVLNETVGDGKDLSIDYGKITEAEKIKELGLVYRQELAKELQAKGYELEITDSRQGFFEMKGFDRETVLQYSSRRREMLKMAQEYGIKDMQKANQYSRQNKKEGQADYDEVLSITKRDLFDSGKIKIEKLRRSDIYDRQRVNGNRGEVRLYEDETGERGIEVFGGSATDRAIEEFAEKHSLSELSRSSLDTKDRRVNLLLSASIINRLAKYQSAKVRSHYLLGEKKRERIGRIEYIVADTIKKLSKEKYAFSVSEATRRIMAAGVLEAITAEEAQSAMEKAKLVKLGRIEREGKKSEDIYLTTQENIEIEKKIVERVKLGKGSIFRKVLTMYESRAALDRAEAKAKAQGLKSAEFTITDREGGSGEQAEAVHHILVSQDRYLCVDGLAGTGKTTMLERLKWIADEQGIEIRGVCFTGKAADGLETESGIKTQTIHSFLNELEGQGKLSFQGDRKEIKQEWDFSGVERRGGREIWAVDEAGLIDMHLMKQLQDAAEVRGAQVLLLGDPDQLPPVGAGEPMRQMEEAGMATAYLYDIRRQKDVELLRAVRESVQGDHLKTFETLEKQGNYREVADNLERRQKIKTEMTAVGIEEYRRNLLLVSTNRDRKAYNEEIRVEYVKRGELEQGKSYEITVHGVERNTQEFREFAAKDRIIFTANDRRLGVMNGTMAIVEKIQGDQITVRTDAGEQVTWSMGKYNSIDHAYAVTNYKAQGMTVDKVVAEMNTKGAAQTRNALYVDISRARKKAVIYTDDKKKLEAQTKFFAFKVTSKDFEKKLEGMRERGGIRNNDWYKAPPDAGKILEKVLAEIEKHTQTPPIVQEWSRRAESKRKAKQFVEAVKVNEIDDKQEPVESGVKSKPVVKTRTNITKPVTKKSSYSR